MIHKYISSPSQVPFGQSVVLHVEQHLDPLVQHTLNSLLLHIPPELLVPPFVFLLGEVGLFEVVVEEEGGEHHVHVVMEVHLGIAGHVHIVHPHGAREGQRGDEPEVLLVFYFYDAHPTVVFFQGGAVGLQVVSHLGMPGLGVDSLLFPTLLHEQYVVFRNSEQFLLSVGDHSFGTVDTIVGPPQTHNGEFSEEPLLLGVLM